MDEYKGQAAATSALSAGLDGFDAWWRGRRYDVDCPSDRRIAEDAWSAARGEKYYPCCRCGVWRTKSEGGTTFTVCDECWDKPPLAYNAEHHARSEAT